MKVLILQEAKMSNIISRVLALMLALVLVLSIAVACAEQPDDGTQPTDTTPAEGAADTTPAPDGGQPADTTPAGSVPADTESPYDENGYLKDTLPSDLNYGDYQFSMLGWNTSNPDFYVEMDTGDTVVDTIYFRNMAVEDRLNIKIYANLIDGDNSNQAPFVEHAMAAIMAGGNCEYDMIGCYSMCGGTLATRNAITDMTVLDYLNFDMPWWSDSLIEMSKINDKLFFVSGDAANSLIYNLYFLIYNHTLGTNLGLSDPRPLVKEGTWTMDKMIEMTTNIYVDAGDAGASVEDTFGYVCYGQVHMDCFIAASGIRMSAPNADGVIQLTDDFTGERTHSLITKLNEWLWSSGDNWYNTSGGYKVITENRALFGAVAGSTIIGLRDKDMSYGIVPYPKMYAEQEQYLTNLGFAYTNFCIPASAKDADMSAAVLEAMGSESHRTSAPALFENCMKSRWAADNLDGEMYDIIKGNLYIDTTRVFSSSFTWSSSAVALFRNSLTGNDSNWASKMKTNSKSINRILENISKSVE